MDHINTIRARLDRRRFRHSAWYNGERITQREALERLAYIPDVHEGPTRLAHPPFLPGRSIFDQPDPREVRRLTDGHYRYSLSDDEATYWDHLKGTSSAA